MFKKKKSIKGNLAAVKKAVKLFRATFRKIKQSLFWAFFYSTASISTTSHPDHGWHNHMPGMWGWGWPFMIIFWILTVLIITLLIVTITKVLKK